MIRTEKELEFEQQLPEFCPDIKRLVRVECDPAAVSCAVEGESIEVNGKAGFVVIYETERKGKLKSCAFSQDFTANVQVPRHDKAKAYAFCRPKCERVTCRLLDPRRISVKALIGLDTEYGYEIPYRSTAVTEDGDVFFRKATIGYDGLTEILTRDFDFSENLSLTQNEKNIGEIISSHITLGPAQVTLSPGRAEIKINAGVSVLYEDEADEENYCVTTKTVPISMTVEDEKINEYDRISVMADIASSNVVPDLDQYGESRIIKADFKVRVFMKISEPHAETVAKDLFEKGCDDEFEYMTVGLTHLETALERSFTVEAELPPNTPMFLSVLESTASERTDSCERAEGGVVISGKIALTLTGMTENGIFCAAHRIPYDQFVQADIPKNASDIAAEVYPLDVNAMLRPDGSISAKVICGVTLNVYTEEQTTFISEVTARRERGDAQDDGTVIFRFPAKGEKLWDIAKEYRADPESISRANPKRFDESGAVVDEEPILIN